MSNLKKEEENNIPPKFNFNELFPPEEEETNTWKWIIIGILVLNTILIIWRT